MIASIDSTAHWERAVIGHPGEAEALQVLREILQELEPRLTHFRLLQQDVEAELKKGRELRESELR